MIFRMEIDMLCKILAFDPKGGFCMTYSLCVMADF